MKKKLKSTLSAQTAKIFNTKRKQVSSLPGARETTTIDTNHITHALVFVMGSIVGLVLALIVLGIW